MGFQEHDSHIVRNDNIYPLSWFNRKGGSLQDDLFPYKLGSFSTESWWRKGIGYPSRRPPRQPAGAARREWGNESQLHEYGSNLGCQCFFHIFENMSSIPIIQLLGVFAISRCTHNGITKFIQYPLGHHHDSLHIQFIQ